MWNKIIIEVIILKEKCVFLFTLSFQNSSRPWLHPESDVNIQLSCV